ncbi:MAG: T9SS type A sorting domain-containing protein [Bacteroidetes bacterium]|nr:T9SS type A sorting domain-containing protein [Bacteroidota bacterium]
MSQKLFDTDTLIEFMYVYGDISNNHYTRIYKENGTLLFSDMAAPTINLTTPEQQYPIYNTPNGTKMILSYSNGQAKVFSLGGTLSAGIAQKSHVFAGSLGNAYPNPVSATTTIPYTLPPDANEGEVVLYNTEGTEVKRFRVDNTFANLQISTNDVPAGTYYYQLLVSGNAIGIKKLIVIR